VPDDAEGPAAVPGPATLRLATFNVHMGVDGWGRPYDLVAECAALDADVLLLQEAWTPDDGRPGTAEVVAGALGYAVVGQAHQAHARLYEAYQPRTRRWGPAVSQVRKTFQVDGERWRVPAGSRTRRPEAGRWGIAVLSRVPCGPAEVVALGKAGRDPVTRWMVRTSTRVAGTPVALHAVHMAHITHPSYPQFRRLARLLPDLGAPAVVAGDMNLWGPPTELLLRGWTRAVTGRTWPAHRPHSQPDHVLVTPAVEVLDARVASATGSDHRPLVVTLRPAAATAPGAGRSGSVVP